jgi:pyridoxamine 5'-phosphate oxidase
MIPSVAPEDDDHPLRRLEAWIADARAAGTPEPASAAFATADAAGRPSARTVTLKRVRAESLVLTTALWTLKARQVQENPHVALLFHWPAAGRQVHVTAQARVGPPELADELWAERDELHRWQTIVSPQGEQLAAISPLQARLAYQLRVSKAPPPRPADWGALELTPSAIEFWTASPADRLHDRRLYTRPAGAWVSVLLAP